MHVRCPHCRHGLELVEESQWTQVSCPSCGSNFSLLDEEHTATYQRESQQVGRFELVEPLGTGAFGTVWRARDAELDRSVAVKIPRKNQLTTDEAEQFLREAQSAAQLNHPNIVSVHEVGRDDGRIFIVSDLIQGASLSEWIETRRMGPRDAVQLCCKTAVALQHAHDAGVIHRDLKPANIMLDLDGEPYVMDFGLAKREAGEITMTVDGRVLGTPAYMPPEQARGEGHRSDARSDVYSLGVILFQLLTGELPFRGNPRMLLVQILNDLPPSPRKLNGSLPRDLETIVLKCLEKEPSRRYDSAQALADDLNRWLRYEPIQARPAGRLYRAYKWTRRHPTAAALIAVSVLAVASLVIGGAWYQARLVAALARETKQATEATRQRNIARDREVLARKRLYSAEMSLGFRGWAESNMARVYSVLTAHAPESEADRDYRTFEWRLLSALANQSEAVLTDHTMELNRIAVSPDGSLAISAARNPRIVQPTNAEVLVWDAQTWRLRGRVPDLRAPVAGVGFSSDSRTLYVADSVSLRSFAVDSLQQQSVLLPSDSANPADSKSALRIVEMEVSPQGDVLVAACDNNQVLRIDPATGTHQLLTKTDRDVECLAFSQDGKQIAIGAAMIVHIWQLDPLKKVAALEGHSSPLEAIAFGADGRIASSSLATTVVADGRTTNRIGELILWDTQGGHEPVALKGHNDSVHGLVFTPDGRQLVTASFDRSVKMWSVQDAACLATFKGHADGVVRVAVTPDGKKLVSAAVDKTIRVWDRQKPPTVQTIAPVGLTLPVTSLAFLPERHTLAAAWGSGIRLWDSRSGREVGVLPCADRVGAVAVSPSGNLIAGKSGKLGFPNAPGEVFLFETASRKQIARFTVKEKPTVVAFLDERRLLVGLRAGNVQVWNVVDQQLETTFQADGGHIYALAVAPDRKQFVSGHVDGSLHVWDVGTKEVTRLAGHSQAVTAVCISVDGKLMASGSVDQSVKLWDFAGRAVTFSLTGHTAGVSDVVFTADSRTLISAGKRIKCWDPETGQERATLGVPYRKSHSLAISSDDGSLAVGEFGVTVWHAVK